VPRALVVCLVLAACSSDASLTSDAGADTATDTATDTAAGFRVLLFSRTTGFRHDSIPTAITALTELGATGGYVAEATEDPAAFTAVVEQAKAALESSKAA